MRSTKVPVKETDLYGPLKGYLEAQGYAVRSEVRGCDVVAERDGDVIVLELKRHLSVSLLAQAVERQRAFDSVYVVVPHPGDRTRTREWRSACRLLRRLELGLVLVDLDASGGASPKTEVPFHPLPAQRKRRSDLRRAVITELHGRSVDLNKGGSTGSKIVTAYRENAVQIACCLAIRGPLSPSGLRELGTGKKTGSILSHNFYKWFDRIARGLYALTAKGREEIADYPELVSRYRAAVERTGEPDRTPR